MALSSSCSSSSSARSFVNEIEMVSGMTLAKKKKTKSKAWIYFGLRVDENGQVIEANQDHPVCRKCGAAVRVKDGNTSNLFQHLRDHADLFATISTECHSGTRERTKTQLTLESSIVRATKYPRGSPQAKELTCAITYFLAKDAMPLYTVEKQGFQHMISKLDSRYEIPSRKVFSSQEIPALYLRVRNDIIEQLKQVKYYAIMTDLWTSGSCEPYITLTVHYIDGEWSLELKCLDTVALFANHTGDNIADCVTDVLSNWELDIKNAVAATTDSGANVIAAFRTLDLLRISCFGHTLDLAVKKGLSSPMIQRALARCCSIANVFHRSWKKMRDLKEKQQLLGLPEHKLKNNVSTRWRSVYKIIDRVIEQQQAISAVIAEDRKYLYEMPTDDELNVLEKVLEVLKMFTI
uniref:BED-type domain-containing protein n=1 Tax=Amphimedon queenslandica TaxID=400682 RepID=A0A1X7TEC0_AMPQE